VGSISEVTLQGLPGGIGVVAKVVAPPTPRGEIRSGVVTMNCNPNAVNPTNIKIHNPADLTGYTASFDTALACSKTLACTVTADDKSFYNVRNIPMVSGRDPNDANDWIYAVDLCSPVPFDCNDCGNQSVYCQVSPSLNAVFCVGSISNVTLHALNGSRGVIAHVGSPPGSDGLVRSGTVTMNCDPTATNITNINFHNPNNLNGYSLSFDSAMACAEPSSCVIMSADGYFYNLTGIPTIAGRDPTDTYGWNFTVNVCSPLPFNCDVCGNQAAYCQVSPSQTIILCAGLIGNVTLKALPQGQGVVAHVTAPIARDNFIRSGTVTMNCNPSSIIPSNIQFHLPTDPSDYSVSFDSALACGSNKPIGPCHTKAADGSLYDITGIQTVSGRDPSDQFGWQYSANLCTPLPMTCDICGTQSAYCQVSPSHTSVFCVGSISSVKLMGFPAGRGLVGYVSSTSPDGNVRSGNVTIICNPNANMPTNVHVVNPASLTGFTISFESALACPVH